jgi:hypothetical protein
MAIIPDGTAQRRLKDGRAERTSVPAARTRTADVEREARPQVYL